jgi:hypothetical protein
MPRFESSSEFCESVISKEEYNLLKEVDKKAHQVETLFNTTGRDSSEMRGKLDGIKGQLLQLRDHEAASNKELTWTKKVYAEIPTLKGYLEGFRDIKGDSIATIFTNSCETLVNEVLAWSKLN